MEALGNDLYPRIASLPGVLDPAKVTGMCLEMGEAKVRELIDSPERLAETVQQAVAVLRQAALHELLSSIVLTEGGERELQGVPWSEEKEALTTPPILLGYAKDARSTSKRST